MNRREEAFRRLEEAVYYHKDSARLRRDDVEILLENYDRLFDIAAKLFVISIAACIAALVSVGVLIFK